LRLWHPIVPLNSPNRRIRTRTCGGVGGAEPRGSPLSRLALRSMANRRQKSFETREQAAAAGRDRSIAGWGADE
jgi:hypothetical protein